MKPTSCSLLLILFINFGNAQEQPTLISQGHLPWETLDDRDGLVQNTVTFITQDPLGFLWFGTQGGLSRYDGYQFTNFVPDPQDPQSISAGYVLFLYPDRAGRIWVSSFAGGIDYYDSHTNRFTHISVGPDDSAKQASGFITSIAEDENGYLWLTSTNGLYRLDPVTFECKSFLADKDDPNALQENNHWYAVLQGGGLWLASNLGGLNRMDMATGRFRAYRHLDKDPATISHDSMISMCSASDSQLWLATYNGLNLFNTRSGLVEKTFWRKDGYLLSDQLSVLLFDRNRNLWIASQRGLTQFQVDANSVIHYQHDPLDPDSLANNYITSLYESSEGIIWAGTVGGGVSKYDPQKANFGHVRQIPGRKNWLADKSVWSACEDNDGSLWLGSYSGGLDHLDPKTMVFENFTYQADDSSSLSNEKVYCILRDRRGTLWVGTADGLDKRTETGFTHYKNSLVDTTTISHNAVYAMLEDSKDRFWLGTYGAGLNRMDRDSGRFVRYQPAPDNANSLGNSVVTSLVEDSDGRVYVGTDAGIDQFVEETDGFIHFRYIENDPGSLSHDAVQYFSEDKYGDLWVGTYGGGLNRWSLQARRDGFNFFTRLDTTHGFPGNVISGVLAENDHLWVGTNVGLVRYDLASAEWVVYGTSHGTQSNEYSGSAFKLTHDGRVLLGGSRGFNLFNADKINFNQEPVPLRFTNFQLFGQEKTLDKPPWFMEKINIDHKETVVSFHFAALDFHNRQSTDYRYKLAGLHDAWIELGAENKINFTSLPFGEHELLIEGVSRFGGAHSSLKLELDVLAPVWRTRWAYGLYVVVFLFVLNGLHQRRVAVLDRRKIILEKLVQKRTSDLHLAQEALVASAHRAGKAEVATHVLHNVGNMLNSISTSAQILREELDKSPNLKGLEHLNQLIEQQPDTKIFFTEDERGKRTPEALRRLEAMARRSHERLEREALSLDEDVRRASALVKSQSDLAGGVSDDTHATKYVDINALLSRFIASFSGSDLQLVGEYHPLPPVPLDASRLNQVLDGMFLWLSNNMAAAQPAIVNIRTMQDMRGLVRLEISSILSTEAHARLNRIFIQDFGEDCAVNLHNVACTVSELGGTLEVIPGRREGATLFLFHLPLNTG